MADPVNDRSSDRLLRMMMSFLTQASTCLGTVVLAVVADALGPIGSGEGDPSAS
jgi:hypothetical protein